MLPAFLWERGIYHRRWRRDLKRHTQIFHDVLGFILVTVLLQEGAGVSYSSGGIRSSVNPSLCSLGYQQGRTLTAALGKNPNCSPNSSLAAREFLSKEAFYCFCFCGIHENRGIYKV